MAKTTAKAKTKTKTKTKSKAKANGSDEFFLQASPQLLGQMEKLKSALESSPGKWLDLKLVGLKVLERAKELSQSLGSKGAQVVKKSPVKKSSIKKGSKK